MGSSVRGHVALMHRVAAAEKHRERHSGTIVMRPGWSGILPRIDIRFHDIAGVVNVIAKNGRDVVRVLPGDLIFAGWRPETGLAGRDGRFAD
jgi:hypothetical protein